MFSLRLTHYPRSLWIGEYFRGSLAQEQKQMLRKASPDWAAPDLPTKCASRCILSFLLRNNLSFVRNSLHILALKTRQFGNILGLAFILINLQYNCQNLAGMALASDKGCNFFVYTRAQLDHWPATIL